MKTVLKQAHSYIARFDRGEDFVDELIKFCDENNITCAFFVGLGGCSRLILASYNLNTKKYEDHEIVQDLEIANITGNVASLDGKTVIHAHGTFGDKNLQTLSGHVRKMIISGTLEIKLDIFESKMEREQDPNTGLNLLR